jgi:hypothetical protein
MHRTRRSWLSAALGLGLGWPSPGLAASLSARELLLIGKVLEFLLPRPAGDGVVAVAYAAGDAASRADAEAIAAALGAGVPVAGGVLRPVVVAGTALAGMRFALVIAAAGASGDAVMRAAAGQRALCVSGEPEAVQAGGCILAIRGEKRVEVFLNDAAARAAGLAFATAFRMMVREV